MSKAPAQVALTANQAQQWLQTRAAVSWACPAFTYIWYKMLNNSGSDDLAYWTKEVPIAATDGSNVLLNPDTFFRYTIFERVFICIHEVMHCILHHLVQGLLYSNRGKIKFADGTELDYDSDTANRAMDYVINDILVTSKVGTFNADWLHDTTLGTALDSWTTVYRKIYNKPPPAKGKGFDQHLAPGTSTGVDPTSAAAAHNPAAWASAIAAGAAAAKAVGKLPEGLESFFSKVLAPQLEWRDKIRGLFARKVGGGSYDFRRPDRRLIVRDIIAPGRSGFGAGTIVVACDSSGSIYGSPKTVDMFFEEMFNIIDDVKPKQLIVMWCDEVLQRVDYCSEVSDLETLRCKGAKGGGGTSFVPVFDEITKLGLDPDVLIYLTDGEGTFPALTPTYPVIWGSIKPTSKYPFGEVVDVPKQVA